MKNYHKKHNQPSLRARRINDMLILVFLALNKAAPCYISDLFTERQTSISLRGRDEVWDRETMFSQLAKRSPSVVVSG